MSITTKTTEQRFEMQAQPPRRPERSGNRGVPVPRSFSTPRVGRLALWPMLSLVALMLAMLGCSDQAANPMQPTLAAPAEVSATLIGLPGTETPVMFTSNLVTGLCMDVKGGTIAQGAPLITWTCHGATNQQFVWKANGEIRSGSLCLDASGGGGYEGDALILWACNGGANQKWRPTSAGEIRGINDMCVDIYAASKTPGAKLIIWRCHGGANQKWDRQGSVTAAAPKPAPIGGGSSQTIFSEGFESGSLGVWDDRGGKDRHRILTNSSLAHSGNRLLEVTYPKGGGGGWLTKFFMPGYDSLYVSYYVRLENSWEGYTKLLGVRGSHVDDKWSAFGKAGLCPSGWNYFSTGVITQAPERGGKVNFYTYYPEMRRDPDGRCWGRYGDGTESYSSSRTLSRGVWHRIEFWIKLNAPGQKNAIQKFWIDGQLRGEWSGISLRKTGKLKLNSVMINASANSPRTQRMYVDDMVVKVGGPPR